MTKLSTYKSEFKSPPIGRTKESDKIVSKENGISFITSLNSNGLKIQPWRIPLNFYGA